MKGGRDLPPNYNQESMEIEEQSYVPENPQPNIEMLQELGFEDGELDMFFETTANTIGENELIDRYLEIAREQPYNQTWQNVNDALTADYELNTSKPNGRPYTKHDIVEDTLNSYYDNAAGGKRRKLKKSRRKYRKTYRKTYRKNNRKTHTHKRTHRKNSSKYRR